MDNWETSPNVKLALLCLCAVKTFFELPFHIIYWHPVARLHPDPAVGFFSCSLPPPAKFTPPAPAGPNANAALYHSAYTPSRFYPLTSFPHTGDLNDAGLSNSFVPPLAMTTLWVDWTCAQFFFFHKSIRGSRGTELKILIRRDHPTTYKGVNGAGTMQPLNKTLSVFISPIL